MGLPSSGAGDGVPAFRSGCPPRHWRFVVSVTSKAIESIRAMIRSGDLSPGERLPPEQELADRLGVSRGSLREAVRALSQINVLDVRRGDGTYVTSLAPSELLSGMVFAMELIQTQGSRRGRRGSPTAATTGDGARRATRDGRTTDRDARGDRSARTGHRSRRDRPPARPVRFVGVRRHRERDPQLDPPRAPDAWRERAAGVAQRRSRASRHRARPISGCCSTRSSVATATWRDRSSSCRSTTPSLDRTSCAPVRRPEPSMMGQPLDLGDRDRRTTRRSMDFDENARTRELRQRLEAFMDEHIYPNEARFFRESMELGPVGGVAGGRGAEATGSRGRAVEPVPPEERSRRRAEQPGVRAALRGDGPIAPRTGGVQLLGTRHRQHGGAGPLRHTRAAGAMAPSTAGRRDPLGVRDDRAGRRVERRDQHRELDHPRRRRLRRSTAASGTPRTRPTRAARSSSSWASPIRPTRIDIASSP